MKTVKQLLGLLLAAALMCTPAFALKGTVVDPDDLTYIPTEGVELPGAVTGTPSDWAQPGVEAAQAAGLVPRLTGSPDYQDTITREQFAELAAQTLSVMLGRELDAAGSDTFRDCRNPSVLKAFAAGVVCGVGDGLFAPDEATNREQIAVMIRSALVYAQQQTGRSLMPLPGDLTKFTDRAQVSDWAAESMGLLTANGIMAGTSATTLSPQDPCTVEQSILLLYQAYLRVANGG